MSGEYRELRLRLWEADPHCHWCGRKTLYRRRPSFVGARNDEAEIDHLRSRHSNGGARSKDYVLACHECNGLRAHIEERFIPDEVKRKRSQGNPVPVYLDDAVTGAEFMRHLALRQRRQQRQRLRIDARV